MSYLISGNAHCGSPNECIAWANEALGENHLKLLPQENPNHFSFIAVGRDERGEALHYIQTITDKEAFMVEHRDGPVDLFDLCYQGVMGGLHRAYKAASDKYAQEAIPSVPQQAKGARP